VNNYLTTSIGNDVSSYFFGVLFLTVFVSFFLSLYKHLMSWIMFLFFGIGYFIVFSTFYYKPEDYGTKIWYYESHPISTWKYEYKFYRQIYDTNYHKKYDYGWVWYRQKVLDGFYFSVNNKKDKEMFKYFLSHKDEIVNSWKKPFAYHTVVDYVNWKKNLDVDNNGVDILTKKKYRITNKIETSDNDLIVRYKRWYEK